MGNEHTASLPFAVVIAAITASLPVSAGAQQLPVADQTLVGNRDPPLPVRAIIDMTELPGHAPFRFLYGHFRFRSGGNLPRGHFRFRSGHAHYALSSTDFRWLAVGLH